MADNGRKTSELKKILMTTDNLGGVWTYTVELLSELEKTGVVTALAIMGTSISEDQKNQLAALKNVKIFHSNYKLEWMEDPWEDVDMAGEWLLNIRDEFRPDIIHLNSFSFGALNWGVPVLTVAHSDVISWWKAVLNCPHPNRLNEYIKRVKYGLENSNYVISPSASMLKNLNDIYGNFKNQKVIYNGRRYRENKAEKKELIFSMGRIWDTAKNISLLINAAPKLKWKVKLAGNPQNPITKEMTVYGNVDFLGGLTEQDVFRYLGDASIFVLPARYEPFGLSPVEAALSGCALVLGDIDSLREIWGDAALYIDPENSDMLVKTINSLIEDKDLLEEYVIKARKKAAIYTPEKMFAEYRKVYNQMLNKEEVLQKDRS
jgi:glycosyltransferase involved in cell wall biosynthesis